LTNKKFCRPLRGKVDRDDAAFLDLSFLPLLRPITTHAFGKSDILCLAARRGARNMAYPSWAEVIRFDATP
jgi:hypothetical protein